MPDENKGVYWLDTRHSMTLVELSDLSGLSVSELTELVEFGAFEHDDSPDETRRFSGECLVTARTAARLRTDFDLQPSGLALAVKFLGRIRELEAQLRDLQARSPRYRR
jgi:hypothetical protein